MNYRKWARLVLVLGIFSLAVSLIYFFWWGEPVAWSRLILQLIPALLMIVLGIWGPRFLGMVQHFPEPVVCPRCKNLTDQTPCSHCGYDFLSEEEGENGDNEEPKAPNWLKHATLVLGGVALLWLVHFGVFRLYPMYSEWQKVAPMKGLSQCSAYQKKGELWQQRWQRSEIAKALWQSRARQNLYHLLLCSVVNGDGIGFEVYMSWWQRGWGREPAPKQQEWYIPGKLRSLASSWNGGQCRMYSKLRQGPLPDLPKLETCYVEGER